MNYVFDIEANGLENPDQIWLVVCKNIDTGEYLIFRNITENANERERLSGFLGGVVRNGDTILGHNCLSFDLPVLVSALGLHSESLRALCLDTLILSRLIDYSRKKHSIEDYGEEFGFPKGSFSKWNDPSLHNPESPLFKELEGYCIRDVDITEKVFLKFKKYCSKEEHKPSIELEHKFQQIVNDLENNGFKFNVDKAKELLNKVSKELEKLDKDIALSFPPREVLIREFTPKATKYGTISKSSVPRALHENISEYEIGKVYRHTKLEPFNPSSHKQLIEVLWEAGWKPVNKTKTHLDLERELNIQKHRSSELNEVDLAELSAKLEKLKKAGWKIDEVNLSTLPEDAPAPARYLAKRIMLEARRRTLTEWISLVRDDGRIHGKFQGIGTWTHRMATQKPNMQNITNEFDTDGKLKLLGKELRQLWQAPKNRLLVGVDAEGIQLRIFAHYIDDEEFTNALVTGTKADKTDPHSLNQRILGDVCKSRAAAKRFIYALLLGAGMQKLSDVLGCSIPETEEALDRLIQRYSGWARIKAEAIPKDAKRGYFIGLDGRKVAIPGESTGERKHLAMSGYLQNGEAIVMKMATLEWYNRLNLLKKDYPKLDYKLVNFVHDEWQTEVNNNMELALLVAKSQADSLAYVGEQLNLKCPLAGSYWNDDHHDYTIGTNWYQTH